MNVFALCIFFVCLIPSFQALSEAQKDWQRLSTSDIDEATKRTPITKKAKNVILFLGDGMSITTITTSRILKGQLKGKTGEEGYLSFERFPNVALLKTYNVDKQVPDSAGTSTAYMSGVKANYGTIGVDENVKLGNCSSYDTNYDTTSILVDALLAKKQVGFVTTTRITHASPASTYAHTANRDWERDSQQPTPELKSKCPDIATQFVDNALDFRVVFGGGRREFMTDNQTDPEYPGVKGKRTDGIDLIAKWKKLQSQKNRKYKYVTNKSEFDKIDASTNKYILGMFEPSHMKYDAQRSNADEPSISEMTKKAIDILQVTGKENGYVLFVEGGRIDHAHHDNYAQLALLDTLAMDKAIEEAIKATNVDDTLLMVTSDHSHVFTFGGWSGRGRPIFDVTDFDWEKGYGKGNANDGKANTMLLYTDGPSAVKTGSRSNVTSEEAKNINYQQQALIPLNYESHGGDDVAVYAQGPWSHLFHRVHEQTYLPYVVRYASCIGYYTDKCPIASASISISFKWLIGFLFMCVEIFHRYI